MRLIDKIKKHGVRESLLIALAHFSNTINRAIYNVCKLFPLCQNRIVLESEGDLSDNAYALYDYMYREGYLKRYNVVWLVSSVSCSKQRVFENTCCVEKYPRHIAAKRSYYLATCKWYIYDHNNVMAFLKKRRMQTLVYLSHGWGYKASKGSSSKNIITRPDYITATGELSAIGLAEYWEEPIEKLLITGYPRIDYFYHENNDVKTKVNDKWNFDQYKTVMFWMPTFRQSINPSLSEEYIRNQTGLPIFETFESLQEFDNFLKMQNILLVFKLHHLQAELPVFEKKFKNIVIIRDEDLFKMEIQTYQLVKLADAVISDYSSITIDYLVLNRPIIYTLDDYDEYNQSRGLFPSDAINYMPGYHVYNFQDLEDSIKEISDGQDKYEQERFKIKSKYHKYLDGNSSKRVLEFLEIGFDGRQINSEK